MTTKDEENSIAPSNSIIAGGQVYPLGLVVPAQNFDPSRDYFTELKADEKWSEDGKEYPYLRGLRRLAHTFRGGVVSVDSEIVKAPSVNTSGGKNEAPDCIAAVTVTYRFRDGTNFAGSADASYKAHKHPFNLHLVATAESKAEARAIRRAFNIAQVSREEIGSRGQDDDRSSEPIQDTQIEGIKTIARRKNLLQKDVLKLIGRDDLDSVTKLTFGEGVQALRAVNRYKPKPKPAEVPASKE